MSPRFDDDPFDQAAAGREWARAQRPNDTRAAAVERGEITDPPAATPTTPPAPAQTRRPSPGVVSKLTSSATRSTSKAGGSVAGVLVGFITYALFLAYLRQGPGGPAMWFRAKFFNEVGDSTGTDLTAPAPVAASAAAGATLGTAAYPAPATVTAPAPATPSTSLPRRP